MTSTGRGAISENCLPALLHFFPLLCVPLWLCCDCPSLTSALVCLSPNHPFLPPGPPPALTQAGQAFLAFKRYQIGADSALFSQDYTDPSQDPNMPYTPYVEPSTGPDPAGMGGSYQQPAFDAEPQGYQSQGY